MPVFKVSFPGDRHLTLAAGDYAQAVEAAQRILQIAERPELVRKVV